MAIKAGESRKYIFIARKLGRSLLKGRYELSPVPLGSAGETTENLVASETRKKVNNMT